MRRILVLFLFSPIILNSFSQDLKRPAEALLDIKQVLESKEESFMQKSQFETQSDYLKRIESNEAYLKLVSEAVSECKEVNLLPYYIEKHEFKYDVNNLRFSIIPINSYVNNLFGGEDKVENKTIYIPFDKLKAEIFYNTIYANNKMFNIFIIPKKVILLDNQIQLSSALILFDLYQNKQITSNFKTTFGTLSHLDINTINLKENNCFVSKNRMINIRRSTDTPQRKDYLQLPLYNLDNLTASASGKIKGGLYYYVWNNESLKNKKEQSVADFVNELNKLSTVSDEEQNMLFGIPTEVQNAYTSNTEALKNREVKQLIMPKYSENESGKVVVDVWVDMEGNVTSATIGKATTVKNTELRASALYAAKKSKFTKSFSSTGNDKAQITYNFTAN